MKSIKAELKANHIDGPKKNTIKTTLKILIFEVFIKWWVCWIFNDLLIFSKKVKRIYCYSLDGIQKTSKLKKTQKANTPKKILKNDKENQIVRVTHITPQPPILNEPIIQQNQ